MWIVHIIKMQTSNFFTTNRIQNYTLKLSHILKKEKKHPFNTIFYHNFINMVTNILIISQKFYFTFKLFCDVQAKSQYLNTKNSVITYKNANEITVAYAAPIMPNF